MASVSTSRGGGTGTAALPDAGAIAPLRASQSVAALNASRPARYDRPRIWDRRATNRQWMMTGAKGASAA